MSGYIGTQPVPQATQTRDSFTATSGQTSFATGGYTPNFLDVYLNGVKLAAADYTASNGSDVVLASGASTGDILEVVAYTTFTVGSSFTPSIDDNGNATALTIDSSENILAGKTSADFGATAGLEFRGGATDTLFLASDGNKALALNRNTSDGEIIRFSKSDSTVGSIGVNTDRVYLATTSKGVCIDQSAARMIPTDASGNTNDANMDLGQSNGRWKDLYLSGGVYLGGTGAANYLSDYESGNWTPAVSSGGLTISSGFTARYTKIGRLVTVICDCNLSGTGNGDDMKISGLPFTSLSLGHASGAGYTETYPSAQNGSNAAFVPKSGNNDAFVYFQNGNGARYDGNKFSAGFLNFTITYFTS